MLFEAVLRCKKSFKGSLSLAAASGNGVALHGYLLAHSESAVRTQTGWSDRMPSLYFCLVTAVQSVLSVVLNETSMYQDTITRLLRSDINWKPAAHDMSHKDLADKVFLNKAQFAPSRPLYFGLPSSFWLERV